MEMEIDDVKPARKGFVFVCYVMKNRGLKRSKMEVPDLKALTVESLKELVRNEMNTWEWPDPSEKPENFHVLHQSRTIRTDEDVKKIRDLSMVHVIQEIAETPMSQAEKYKSEAFIAEYIEKRNVMAKFRHFYYALISAVYKREFVSVVETFRIPGILETIYGINVPELLNDPVAVGMLQDATLLERLCEENYFHKMVHSKPWLVEALCILAALVLRQSRRASLELNEGMRQDEIINMDLSAPPHLLARRVGFGLAQQEAANRRAQSSQDGNQSVGTGTSTAQNSEAEVPSVGMSRSTRSTQPRTTGSWEADYQHLLPLLQSIGLTDNRVNLLALREFRGNVNTAAEHLLCGWLPNAE